MREGPLSTHCGHRAVEYPGPVNSYVTALLVCAAVAAFEGLCAGKEPLKKLAQLKQPGWSPPSWMWVLIGLCWYGFCFVALVRLLPHYAADPMAVRLLGLLMAANAFANLFQFRAGRLDLAWLMLLPYWLVLAMFVVAAAAVDRLTTVLFAIYAVYQIYAAAWGWQLWALNGKHAPWVGAR